MKIGILSIGQVAPEALMKLAQGLVKIFPDTACSVIEGSLSVLDHALDKKRNQYNSGVLLNEVRVFVAKKEG